MALVITIKPVIMRAQQRADSSYNVKIRVTFKRRYRILSTNLTAYPKDLARSGEIKGAVLLDANKIIEKMYGAVAELNWFDLENMEVEDIVRWIRQSLKGKASFKLDFFGYAEGYMASKKPSTASVYRSAVTSFRNFIGGPLDINDITVQTIKRYVTHMNSTAKGNFGGETKSLKKKGVAAKVYTSKLSAIYNEAMNDFNDEESGAAPIRGNPFRRVKVEAEPSVARIAKSPEFIQKLIDACASPSTPQGQTTAIGIYLISFCLMGANAADLMVMTPPDKDGILTYFRSKTKDRRHDRAEMRIRLEPYTMALMGRFAGTGTRFFMFSQRWRNATALNTYLRKNLSAWARANGEDDFTANSARHSWGTIARSSRVGLSKSLVDECLAHSTNQLVDVYAEKDWSILWEANRKVLDLFDWSKIR